MLMEKLSPESIQTAPIPIDTMDNAESAATESLTEAAQLQDTKEEVQDEAMAESTEESSAVEEHTPENMVVLESEDAQDHNEHGLSTEGTCPQSPSDEESPAPGTNEIHVESELEVDAPIATDILTAPDQAEEEAPEETVGDLPADDEPATETTNIEHADPSLLDEEKGGMESAGSVSGSPIISAKMDDDQDAAVENAEHVPKQDQAEELEADSDSVMEDHVQSLVPEPQTSETHAADVANVTEDEGIAAAHAGLAEAGIDTLMESHEEHTETKTFPLEDSATDTATDTKTAAHEEAQPITPEQLLQADAALGLGSDSALEDDGLSVSDEEMDETEHIDEDGFTVTELPDADVEDATNIPSPSLSAAESPRFSAIADTLTLNLPDRTPPKNRTKGIPEEPASPIDEDTAFLKDFLSRANTSKATREASTARRESITNRRDSNMVRQALASPRLALESKDPNSPNTANAGSPVRKGMAKDPEELSVPMVLDGTKLELGELTGGLGLEAPAVEPTEAPKTSSKPQNTRRSARARQTRLPAAPSTSTAGPNRIQFRRADGTEPIVLKKSEAQELANATRNNTRRNKGTALAAPIRLNKLKAESLKASAASDAASPKESMPVYANPEIEVYQASKLRWDQQLVYFQEEGNLAGLTSLSDDELAGPAETTAKIEKKSVASTPARTKRAKGLGAGNGTPAKGLLAPPASLLPTEVQAEMQAPTSSKISNKKPTSSSTTSSKTSSSRGKKTDTKPTKATLTPSPFENSSKIPSLSSSVDPSSSTSTPPTAATATATTSTPAAAPAPETTPSAQPQPSLLPTPSSRRSRLQTPRKVTLPVPISSSSAAPPTSAPAAQSQNSSSQIIGSTPKKMPLAKPAEGGGSGSGSGGGGGSQGLSAGRRRAVGMGVGRRV